VWSINLGSMFGLGRHWSKVIGTILIALGFFLSTPPGLIFPDDFLNVALAGILVWRFHLSLGVALLLTYTVIAWSLIFIGACFYPCNTFALLRGLKTKIVNAFMRILTNPVLLILSIIGFFIIYYLTSLFANVYMNYLIEVLT